MPRIKVPTPSTPLSSLSSSSKQGSFHSLMRSCDGKGVSIKGISPGEKRSAKGWVVAVVIDSMTVPLFLSLKRSCSERGAMVRGVLF